MLNIYKASAGSGKTFALTREYLSLLLGQRDPETGKWSLNKHPRQGHRHILAITFTNKATDEMTARIISQLAILGRRDPNVTRESQYMPSLCARFNTDPDTLAALASDTLDDTLFDFAYFHVSTIDAFFQTVLRTFTREVELPDDYAIEIDNRYTIALGVHEMFRSLNYRPSHDPIGRQRNKWLTQWLSGFMRNEIDSGRSVNIFSRRGGMQGRIVGMINEMFDETFKLNSEAIINYLSDLNRLTAFTKALDSQRAKLDNAIKTTASELLAYAGDYANGWSATNALKPITALADGSKDATKLSDAFMSRVADHSPMFKKGYNPPPDIAAGIDARIDSLLALAEQCRRVTSALDKLRDGVTHLGLLGCTLYFINDLCKDNNLIMLSETGTILRDIISDDDTPFVYERLGYYLNHFLIDEFQDTSRMQWEILRPMLLESLSRGEHDLIIGDEKQSIYRFRNSDPELLGHEVADTIDDTLGYGLTDITGLDITQNNNWRSSAEVIKFNNSLFRILGHAINADDVYSTVIQRIDPSRENIPSGHVVIEQVRVDNDDTASSDDSPDTQGGVIPSSVLSAIRSHIERLLSQGWKYRDIALLVRRHREGQQIINYLLSLNDDPDWPYPPIEIASTDALEIASSPAVRLIIDMLRLSVTKSTKEVERKDQLTGETMIISVDNEAHRLTSLTRWYQYFTTLANSDRHHSDDPTVGESALYKAVIMVADESNLDEHALDWRRQVEETLQRQRDLSGVELTDLKAGTATLDIVIDTIIERYITPETIHNETVYIAGLMDLVLDFISTGGNDVKSFLDWWDRQGCHQTLSSLPDADALSVMTIHQSKGLEFPCVIIPCADWNMVTYSNSMQSAYGWYPLDSRHLDGIPPELIPPMIPVKHTKDLQSIPLFAEAANEYARTQRVDALNLAYVAFTRACNELIAFVPVSDKSDDNRLATLIDMAIQSKDMPQYTLGPLPGPPSAEAARWVIDLADHFNAERGILEYGEPAVAPAVLAKEDKVTPYGTDMTTEPFSPLLPSYTPGTNISHTGYTEGDCLPLNYDNPVDRGIIVHSILSRITDPARLPVTIRRRAYRLNLTTEQTADLTSMLTRALADERVTPWFKGYRRVANERSLAGMTLRRPDRIVWTQDGHVDVIDYKTGAHNPRYHDQVRLYVDRLRRSGECNVRGWLWYVAEGNIVSVDTSAEAMSDMFARYARHSLSNQHTS